MSDKKYHKVIVTKEYVVEAESESEARKLFRNFSEWEQEDVRIYELTDNDLDKYGITKS
jgi:hypothetical protein